MSKRLEFVLFPDSAVALNQEVRNHPHLMERLSKHKFTQNNFTEMLMEIATYCNIAIEGYIDEDGLDDLCTLLTQKLRDKSTILIL